MADNQKKLVVLTGAGISAESGISTFRDSGGLWEKHRVEDVASPSGFKRDPRLVWRFYKARYLQSLEVEPNPGHYALVQIEEQLGGRFTLVTQNVDGLHYRAGSQRVFEMHGRLRTAFCTACNTKKDMSELDLKLDIPICPNCQAAMRPDIVWFGEIPYYMYEIESALKDCSVLMVIGTSGAVYPAAGFVMTAKYMGARTICVNLDRPDNMIFVDEFHKGKAGEILPNLVEPLLNSLA